MILATQLLAASVLEVSAYGAYVLLLLAMAASFLRVVRGPSLPDRVIALDLLSITLVAFCAVYAVDTGEVAFLDVSLALALMSFYTTVAFARYVEQRGRDEGAEEGDA